MKDTESKYNDGFYAGMPFEEYASIKRINFSNLKHLISDTPKHFLYRWKNPKEPTHAMIDGRLIHEYILETELFNDKYFPAPTSINEDSEYWKLFDEKEQAKIKKNPLVIHDKRTSINKMFMSGVQAFAKGKEVIAGNKWEMYKSIKDSLLSSKFISKILGDKDAYREVTILWTCPITGAKCKGRLDLYKGSFYVDLKSAVSANPSRFIWDAKKRLYHAQSAFYCMGVDKLIEDGVGTLSKIEKVILLACEKEPPYASAPFFMATNSPEIEYGKKICTEALETLKHCSKNNSFPGYVSRDGTSEFIEISMNLNLPDTYDDSEY